MFSRALDSKVEMFYCIVLEGMIETGRGVAIAIDLIKLKLRRCANRIRSGTSARSAR